MNKFILKGCISLAASLLAVTLLTTSALAATNQALGSIGTVSADLADSNIITLNSQGLSLFKRAFLASDNSAIADGSTLASGTRIRFLIYVNNPTSYAVGDVRVTDQLAGFAFVPLLSGGVLKETNVLNACAVAACTAGEESGILTAVLATADKTEAADGDSLSYDGGTTTVSAGLTANTTSITANASSAWGMVFEATIQ